MNHISKRYPDEFNKSNVRKDALRHLANEYHIEETSANRRVKLAQSLLNQIISERSLNISEMEKELFIEGAYIYYLGSFIDSDSSSPHTYYLIANSMINGFSHKDRVKLALLASFKTNLYLNFIAKKHSGLVIKK